MSNKREVSKKLLDQDDTVNWYFTCEDLKDYDHVYVNGVRYVERQPAVVVSDDHEIKD